MKNEIKIIIEIVGGGYIVKIKSFPRLPGNYKVLFTDKEKEGMMIYMSERMDEILYDLGKEPENEE